MATKKPNIKVETGNGLPTSLTKGSFYKDLETDVLYSKNKAGEWKEKPVKPAFWIPQYQ